MPYYITDTAPDCSGWAVVKSDGEQLGCHQTKQDAIDQMVALSISEDIQPGGELSAYHGHMLKFHAGEFTIDAAAGDAPRRTISGIAVRYNTEAQVSDGTRVMFAPGSIPTDGPAPKLFMFHDPTKVIGRVTELVETDQGLLFTAKVSETALGSEALVLAADGALSDVSVGVEPTKFRYDDKGRMVITASRFLELSVVPHGAFDAPILDVAASIHQTEEQISNTEEQEPEKENPEMSEKIEAPAVVEAAPITQTLFAQARPAFKMPSIHEYMAKFMRGGSEWQEFNAKIRAAAPDVVTSDLDGVVPEIWTTPVYDGLKGLRPVIDAIGVKAMPQAGKVFIRPKVTTHTTIGGPQTENNTITSGTYVISDEQVTKGIYGGYVEVSEASIDWSSPEVLSLLLGDMAKMYALKTDDVAADALASGVTNTTSLTDPTDPAEWVADIYDVAAAIMNNSNYLPTHIFVSPDVYAKLGGLSDSSDRPLFPQVGPMNAFGTMTPGNMNAVAFGLQVVVDKNFAAKTCIVGNPMGFEIFEQQKGAISIDSPSTLSRTIAFRGYFATLMIDADKFYKITLP
jgi:HK97 family phage prohead protease/HK97 family phage major capsid protein